MAARRLNIHGRTRRKNEPVKAERRPVKPHRSRGVLDSLAAIARDLRVLRRQCGIQHRRFLNRKALERTVRHRQHQDRPTLAKVARPLQWRARQEFREHLPVQPQIMLRI